MVFEPEAAPRNHQSFLDWFHKQTKWTEGHSYGDPAVTSARLRAWYLDIIARYPPLNGVLAEEELPEDEASATDYSIGSQIVYAAFAWSKVDEAYKTVFELAAKHQVGFFNVSSDDEEVWLPNESGLTMAHARARPSFLKRLRQLFRRS